MCQGRSLRWRLGTVKHQRHKETSNKTLYIIIITSLKTHAANPFKAHPRNVGVIFDFKVGLSGAVPF